MDRIKKHLREHDRLAQHLGMALDDVQPGSARGSMKVENFHLNSVGTVHGGAMFTLADFTFAAAANSRGRLAVLANASVTYFKPGKTATLHAEAKEISLGHKLGVYEVRITDTDGELVALFIGTAYRKEACLA